MGQNVSTTICNFGNEQDQPEKPADKQKRRISSLSTPNPSKSPSEKGHSLVPDHDFQIDSKYKTILKKYWTEIAKQKPEIFHIVLLKCFEASPKLTTIISCGKPCQQKLDEWPRLKEISDLMLKFFENMVVTNELNSDYVKEQATNLGKKHKSFARYGMQPHYLNIIDQKFMEELNEIKIDDLQDKKDFIDGWTLVMAYVIERTFYAYSNANI
uniref:Globin family profile domain-containing protein n=1 Tax=Panagrolaimus sp. JU765 TaxID=591449 RepID=A0AC34RQA6_9BILA